MTTCSWRSVSEARNSSAIPPTARRLRRVYLPKGVAFWRALSEMARRPLGPGYPLASVPVEALSGLLPQLTRSHHLLQKLGRPEGRAPQLEVQVFGDGQPDVQAH